MMTDNELENHLGYRIHRPLCPAGSVVSWTRFDQNSNADVLQWGIVVEHNEHGKCIMEIPFTPLFVTMHNDRIGSAGVISFEDKPSYDVTEKV